jgi:hypothetical protein
MAVEKSQPQDRHFLIFHGTKDASHKGFDNSVTCVILQTSLQVDQWDVQWVICFICGIIILVILKSQCSLKLCEYGVHILIVWPHYILGFRVHRVVLKNFTCEKKKFRNFFSENFFFEIFLFELFFRFFFRHM